MEVNETRICLVTDIFLNIKKSSDKTQMFNSGSGKMSLFPKKWSILLTKV